MWMVHIYQLKDRMNKEDRSSWGKNYQINQAHHEMNGEVIVN